MKQDNLTAKDDHITRPWYKVILFSAYFRKIVGKTEIFDRGGGVNAPPRPKKYPAFNLMSHQGREEHQ